MAQKRIDYAAEYAKKMAARAYWTEFYARKRRRPKPPRTYDAAWGAVADPQKPGTGGAG